MAILWVIKINIQPNFNHDFSEWGVKLYQSVIGTPGFISLDMVSSRVDEWIISFRFENLVDLNFWKESEKYQILLKDLSPLLALNQKKNYQEMVFDSAALNLGVTEILITKVHSNKIDEYKKWLSKIHKAEAQFSGFRGMYVHPPLSAEENFWITLLQFDTQQNLDAWVTSPERLNLVKEGESMVALLERHRVISSYSGWFESIAKQGEIPPVWKQTMLVLLVLYPIVMLEMQFLAPLLGSIKFPISMFISNAISVSLIAWPFLPMVIKVVSWWLDSTDKKTVWLGIVLVFAMYLLEIFFFLKFF